MKANRKFVQADEAVSPVIAVILMVAITVVLAATVFVLVSDIGGNTSKAAPQMGWSDDESNDKWTVTQAPNQIEWDDFNLKSDQVAGFSLNGDPAAVAGTALAANTEVAVGTGTVAAGDYIGFCGAVADTTFTLRHVPTNAVSHTFKFASLDACA